MGKLRVLSGAEICQILQENGFVAAWQRGSHKIMQKWAGGVSVTVPVPLHRPVRPGTLLSIIRQSGLMKRLFETE